MALRLDKLHGMFTEALACAAETSEIVLHNTVL